MKKHICTFFLAALLGTNIVTEANAQQSKSTNNEPVYVFADKMPAFPGGEEALKAYFEKALSGLNSDSRGLVALSLVINKNGKADEVIISQGLKPEIDAAVVKAAQNMPAWQPGVKDSKSVNVRVSIPVVIQMSQQAISAQETEASKRTYEYVEQMPEFPGGQNALMTFIKDNTQYPEEAVKNKLEGMVFVKFTVTYEGNITDTEVLKTPANSLSNEALRVIGLMPKWKPGKQNGRAVNTKYTIPFRFTLPESTETKKEAVEEKPYEYVEQMPYFLNGGSDLENYVNANLMYPESGIKEKIQGVTYIRFIIGSNGEVKNPEILRSLGPDFDKEAIRLVTSMPRWNPGKMNGRQVPVKFTMPIKFTLPAK